MISKRIAQYVVDLNKRLGKGNFGEVFHAFDSETKQFVAIKQVSVQGKMSTGSAYQQILNEIKIMKSISSPNVVAILDVQKTANNLYIVMEYCNQGTLEEYMRLKCTLAESEAKMFLS
jgi:serine/threonine-protein kinase ULK/ATG1